MPLLLARIDDRLIHGQVAHGWGRVLRPTLFAIVSDSLRADPDRADLYLYAIPEGARGRVVSVAESLGLDFRAEVESERTIVLFPGTEEPLRLAEGGFALADLNIGGLHHAAGKVEVLPYVYLDDADRGRLRAIERLGVRVFAQDLPSNPSHMLGPMMEGAD